MVSKERKSEPEFPIKTFHEFLYDVGEELKKFRRVAVISVLASLFLLLILVRFFYLRFLFPPTPQIKPWGLMRALHLMRGALLFDLILVIVALVCLFYSVYALWGQNAFFKRWGERISQLTTLEETLLGEKEENK